MRIYIASPLGFSEIGRKFYYEQLINLLVKEDFDAIDPWTLISPAKINRVNDMEYGAVKKEAWEELNQEIAERNADAIDSSDALLAILDGTDVDSGTASEIGYAFAKGKIIVGYRGDFRLSGDNEGATVNLQVEYFIRKSGGEIVTNYQDIPVVLKKIFSNCS